VNHTLPPGPGAKPAMRGTVPLIPPIGWATCYPVPGVPRILTRVGLTRVGHIIGRPGPGRRETDGDVMTCVATPTFS
jgi:hypothetical protein